MVTIPTKSEIKSQILTYIEAADTSTTLLPSSWWDVLAGAMAGAIYLLYKFGLWLYSQIFTSTMDSDALTLRGTEVGVSQDAATKWKGTATATGDDDTVIAVGKLCTYGDYAYQVTEEATISGGTVTVSLESLSTGQDVGLEENAELSWSTPGTGLDSTLTVVSTTQEAEDKESTSSFRSNILSVQQNKPQGGAIPDFITWALEVSGIGECFVDRPSVGYVNVYPLIDGDDPEDRLPSDAQLTSVEDYINDDYTYPFARECSALSMEEQCFDITFSNLSPSSTTLQGSIEEAVEDYLYERRPQQYSNQTTLKNEVSAGKITALAIAAGAIQITVTLYSSSGADITDSGYELEIYELASPGEFTWE